MPIQALYPLDTLGTAPSNRVGYPTKIDHVITIHADARFNYIVPAAAPFFDQNLKVYRKTGPTTYTLLTKNVHYVLGHRFNAATAATGKGIYGSIVLTNLGVAVGGTVTIGLDYQSLGGNFTFDMVDFIRQLTNERYTPRTMFWDQIPDVPDYFPPVEHQQGFDDLMGWDDVVAAVNALATVIQNSGLDPTSVAALITAHATNPNAHSKAQVGLPLVPNWAAAVVGDYQAAIATTKFASVADVKGIMAFHGALSATRLATPRTISLGGVVQGSVSFDGSGNVTITTSYTENPLNITWGTLSGVPSDLKTGKLSVSRIPDLDAAIITTGTFHVDRIPGLDGSKISAGTISIDRLPNITAAKIDSVNPSALSAAVPIEKGGTGATTVNDARANLGLQYASEAEFNAAIVGEYIPRVSFLSKGMEYGVTVGNGSNGYAVGERHGYFTFPNWLGRFTLVFGTCGNGVKLLATELDLVFDAVCVLTGTSGANSYSRVTAFTSTEITLANGSDGGNPGFRYVGFGLRNPLV